jgi:eukaryotic-like serine/threonine-protein kinase
MAASAHTPVVRIGQILDQRYCVDRYIGEGAMGFVFAARNIDSGQAVALKLLRPALLGDRLANERFRREIRATMQLDCEHVARTLDVGHLDNGAAFMVMEYLDGCDLSQVLRTSGPLVLERAVDCVLQACVALAHAHRLGIVHRDIKPANLLLVREASGRELVKVLDFGISKLRPSADTTAPPSLTGNAVRLGSPLYVSPEQKTLARAADERSDIWSLGITLFELITGSVPFDASPLSIRGQDEPATSAPSIARYRSGVPRGLDRAVARCLQRLPQNRFQNVAELAESLTPFASAASRQMGHQVAQILGLRQQLVAAPASASVHLSGPRSLAAPIGPGSTLGPVSSRDNRPFRDVRGRWLIGVILVGTAVTLALMGRSATRARESRPPIHELAGMAVRTGWNRSVVLPAIMSPARLGLALLPAASASSLGLSSAANPVPTSSSPPEVRRPSAAASKMSQARATSQQASAQEPANRKPTPLPGAAQDIGY